MKTLVITALLTAFASAPSMAQTNVPTRAAKSAQAAKGPATTVPKAAPKPAAPATPEQTATDPTPESASDVATTAGGLFGKGTTMVSLGIGLGLDYGDYGAFQSTPALSLAVEHGIADGIGPGTIGIGGLVGYKAYHYKYPGSQYKARWTNVIVAARGTYHYNLFPNPKLDTYGGLSLGLRVEKRKNTYYDDIPELRNYAASSAHFTPGVFAGARYFLTDHLGAFAEAGYDMNYLKLGVTAKF